MCLRRICLSVLLGWLGGEISYAQQLPEPVDSHPVLGLDAALLSTNLLSVSPSKLSPTQVAAGTSWIDYTVQFQNTSGAVVRNVLVIDSLPADHLQLNTLQLVGFSHTNRLYPPGPDGVMQIYFGGINLDTQGRPSTGFARFRVRPQTWLSEGTRVMNKVWVVFDRQAPLGSGLVLTTVTAINGVAGDQAELDAQVWPNPASDQVQLEAALPTAGELALELRDATGRLVRQERSWAAAGTWRRTVPLDDLAAGLYFLDVRTADARLSRRVVVR